jgi:hypothetical protein
MGAKLNVDEERAASLRGGVFTASLEYWAMRANPGSTRAQSKSASSRCSRLTVSHALGPGFFIFLYKLVDRRQRQVGATDRGDG